MKMSAAHPQVLQSVQRETAGKGESLNKRKKNKLDLTLKMNLFCHFKLNHHTALKIFRCENCGDLLVLCRKTESNDMHDLVHMMTQTLRMDVGDGGNEVDKGRFGSTALPEFKLNRKYRDTLVLHGKARGQAENLSLGEIPIGQTFI